METWADKYELRVERMDSDAVYIHLNGKELETRWTDVECIMAYRTNKISNSPLHIDLRLHDGGTIPLNSKRNGWNYFLQELPRCLPLQDFAMLKTPPFTQRVFNSSVFTLLYDQRGDQRKRCCTLIITTAEISFNFISIAVIAFFRIYSGFQVDFYKAFRRII